MNRDDVQNFKEELLGRDIRQLGRLLGDTIRAQHGDQVFDRIESIRKMAISFRRDQDQATHEELHATLKGMSSDQAAHSAIFPCCRTSPKTSSISPLNHLQVELLRRYRDGVNDESTRSGLHMSINGVAAGLRNSG